MQNIVPFCRECGSKVEDDWVACPKCGSKMVPTSTNQNDGSSDMKTTANTVIEKSEEKPNSSNIALLLLAIMFMVILIPGEADMSLLSWGDEDCDFPTSSTGNSILDQAINEGSESYESYCSKKKATLFFCVLIIIACIAINFNTSKSKQTQRLSNQIENVNLQLQEKNPEEVREEALRKEALRKEANEKKKEKRERWKQRDKQRKNKPIVYYSIFGFKIILFYLFTALLISLIGINLEETEYSSLTLQLILFVTILFSMISVEYNDKKAGPKHRRKASQISEEDIEGEEEKFACEECGHCPVMESDSTCPNCGAIFEDDGIVSSISPF